MKEKLYTIPLNDAMNAEDECPFCFIERNVEQDIMDYVLGSCASSTEDGEPYMYAQPDDSSPTVARLKEGTRLRLLELGQAQGWYKVETASGAKKSGWMMRHTLVPNPYNTCWK